MYCQVFTQFKQEYKTNLNGNVNTNVEDIMSIPTSLTVSEAVEAVA
jgi:hypothetical protein